jgi:subtilisin family serine protease
MRGLKVYRLYVLFLSLFIFLFSGVALGASNYISDEILVKFKPKIIPHKLEERVKAVEDEVSKVGVKAKVKKDFLFINVHHLKILDGTPVEKVIERLKANPNVEYAEPNYIYSINLIPNDPLFNRLWGLNNTGQTGGTPDSDIDAPEAWDMQTGSDNVVVGVIDTGVDYTHEDLSANMWLNPFEVLDGIDNDGNGYIDDIYGINAITGSGNPMDDNGHGTHVSGTIGAIRNNGKGITGVTNNVKIMALKFLNSSGSGTTADAIECIQYVLNMKNKGVNIKVTNNSWGGGGFSQSLYDAIKALKDSDILFAAAAGNSSTDNDSKPFYPASYDLENIISVAATDHNDNLASFSNYGLTSVDVAAPGVNILSTLPGGGYTPNPADIFFDNMELGDSNWTAQSTWAITAEQNYTSGGRYAWSDSPYSTYSNFTNSSLTSKIIDLSGISDNLMLGFFIKGRLETNYDYLYVEVSKDGGSTWSMLGAITGNISNWQLRSYPIPSDFKTSNFRFRFRIYTDYSVVYDGVYIDNVGIGLGASNNYGSYSGTSMATPHVSGLAALISSEKPLFSYSDIKDTILNTVDFKPSLAGKILTGGRINAYNALMMLVPPQSPPSPPGNLTATSVSNSIIDLNWTDNSSNEIGFRIERRTETGSYIEIATLPANVTSYSDTGLTESTRYYYRIRAYNGAGYSDYSNEASSITMLNAPSNLTATAASGSRIDLKWTDNSNKETGFKIERRTDTTAFTEIATVGANTTSYSDTGLNKKTRYYYRIKAYNNDVESSYSNEISIRTKPN